MEKKHRNECRTLPGAEERVYDLRSRPATVLAPVRKKKTNIYMSSNEMVSRGWVREKKEK